MSDQSERPVPVSSAKRSFSFRALLFAQGALVAATPLVVAALIGSRVLVPQINAAVEEHHQALTRGTVVQIETHLASARREMVAISGLVDLLHTANGKVRPAAGRSDRGRATEAPPADDEIHRMLDAVVGNGLLYEAVYLATRDGTVFAVGLPAARRAGRADLIGIDLSRREFVAQALRTGELVWSSSFLSVISGRMAIALALPVRQGVLVAELALGQFSYFMRELPVSANAVAMVIDQQGHVIGHPRAEVAGQQISVADQPLVRDAFAQGAAFGRLTLDGRQLVGAMQTIKGVSWVVMVAEPVAGAYRLIDSATVTMLVGFAIALIVALYAAYLLAAMTSRGLAVLATNAGELADGRYDVAWPKTRITEFIRLNDDLRRMANAVHGRELALQQSETHHREVLESSADLVTQVDAEGRFIYVNPAAERIYGSTQAECIGRLGFDFVHPDDRLQTQEAFVRWLASKTDSTRFENRQISLDGKVYNVVWSIHAHRNAEGEVVEFSSIGHDMTEYRRAEAEIRRLALVASATSNAVLITDASGRVEWINAACAQMTGYSLEDLQGRQPWVDRLAEDASGAAVDRLDKDMAIGSSVSGVELRVRHRSGQLAWHSVEVQPVRDARGRLVQFVVIETDVTTRRAAQEALKASEERFLALFNSSPVPVAVSRYDEHASFIDCNEAWLRKFGRSREEIVGKSGPEIGMWANLAQRETLLSVLGKLGIVDNVEVELRNAQGSTLLFLVSGRVITVAGDRLIVFAYRDITDERRIERQIRILNATLEERVGERTSALEAANIELRQTLETLQHAQDELIRSEKFAALGSLVAGVAHELNTPIGNSLMAASTLDEHARDFARTLEAGTLRKSTLDRFVRDACTGSEIVVRNLQKASELVTSFKQVAVDQASAQRRAFTLEELVSEIVLTLRPSFRKTPFSVEYEVPDLTIDSFPGPLGQVLSNLINNALVHAFEGRLAGQVRIHATPIGKDRVRLVIDDDGCGIPPEHLPRIFDPFFTTKLGKGGSGLGLHISHNIVTRVLGGNMRVESSAAGTRFVIEIPCHAPDART